MHVLTGGAVIEPDTAAAGRRRLLTCKVCLRERAADGRWPDGVRRPRRARPSRSREALTTPLELVAAPPGLRRRGRRPRRSCWTPAASPPPRRITDHLLDHLVEAAFSAGSRRGDIDWPHSFRPHRDWDPEAAQRWLSSLADHLQRHRRPRHRLVAAAPRDASGSGSSTGWQLGSVAGTGARAGARTGGRARGRAGRRARRTEPARRVHRQGW